MHILSPETDNCPSWISGRERMTVENISWSISTKECCRPRRGLNPRPPGLQSDGASNWATEATEARVFGDHMKEMSNLVTLLVFKGIHSRESVVKILMTPFWKKYIIFPFRADPSGVIVSFKWTSLFRITLCRVDSSTWTLWIDPFPTERVSG